MSESSTMTNTPARRPVLTVRRCLLLCLVGFIFCTVMDINGSSTAYWSVLIGDGATSGTILLGKAREARSDEWLAWTPCILSQASHQPAWPVENPSIGAGKSPLVMSLPVRHYSMFFRPQLYGFFLFGTEWGFSWYWNVKIFGLLATMFGLFFLLTQRVGLALCGAALVFSAGYVQWFFSCPPMLPEMLSMWALALICIITLTRECVLITRLGATAGLIVGVINFALCCYPPFQVPLVYLGVAILGGWFWQKHATARASRMAMVASFSVAAICICGVLAAFIIECLPTLHMVANTSYPGARRCYGGGVSFVSLLRGIAAPLVFEQSYPKTDGNVGDASSFFPFAFAAIPLLVTGLWRRRRKGGAEWGMLLGLLGFFGFFAVFSLVPMPHWLAVASGLSFTTTVRWVLPIGLANIFIAILFFPHLGKMGVGARCAAWGVAMALVGSWLVVASGTDPTFFTGWRTVALTAGAGVVFGSYLTGRAGVFTLCSLGILGPASLSVNPVTQGLCPLLNSPTATAIHDIAKTDPTARWVAYDCGMSSQFLVAQGVPVLGGAQTVPDLPFYDQIDPGGRSRNIYNRYGLAVYQMPKSVGEVGFTLMNFCSYAVSISPTNPILYRAGVRFYVFLRPVKIPGFQLLKAMPYSHMWIYRDLTARG